MTLPPPFTAGTDHRIVVFGDNQMQLFDSRTGQLLVSAQREPDQLLWTIRNEVTGTTLPDLTAGNRSGAIDAMETQALRAIPRDGGLGYSTTVPRGLREQP
jgi:hypothetical protein